MLREFTGVRSKDVAQNQNILQKKKKEANLLGLL